MRHYYAYRRSQFGHSKLHELNERADVEHWLHTMLFKIALPVCRDEFMHQVYSPLTITTFSAFSYACMSLDILRTGCPMLYQAS
jgi:hypothetical protein